MNHRFNIKKWLIYYMLVNINITKLVIYNKKELS